MNWMILAGCCFCWLFTLLLSSCVIFHAEHHWMVLGVCLSYFKCTFTAQCSMWRASIAHSSNQEWYRDYFTLILKHIIWVLESHQQQKNSKEVLFIKSSQKQRFCEKSQNSHRWVEGKWQEGRSNNTSRRCRLWPARGVRGRDLSKVWIPGNSVKKWSERMKRKPKNFMSKLLDGTGVIAGDGNLMV